MADEMEICANCKREIPSSNYVVHTVHCHRNIAVCPKCSEPVPRSELAEHQITEHSNVVCDACGAEVEQSQLAKHKKDTCPSRIMACPFCELEMGARDLPDHENYCGSRTERCEECEEFVMLKYRSLHLDSNHGFIKLSDEPGPPPSWEPPSTSSSSLVAKSFRPTPRSSFTPFNKPLTVVNPSRPNNNTVQPNLRPKVPNTPRFSDSLESNAGRLMGSAEVKKPSPVKRENHQPQLNTKQQALEKTTPTPSLPEALVEEDLDHILAMRLAQEDMEMLSPNQVNSILQGNEELPEAAGPPIRDLHAMSLANQNFGLSSAFMLPPPDVAMALDADDVEIPCEFCDVLIPASRLVLHQTGCRPDLARYQPINALPCSPPGGSSGSINNGSLSMVHNNLGTPTAPLYPIPIRPRPARHGAVLPPSKNDDDECIPCDLCHHTVPARLFLQHQLGCEIRNLPSRQVERPSALVMPLSGKSLRLRAPNGSAFAPPSAKNLLQGQGSPKTMDKPAPPGQDGAHEDMPGSASLGNANGSVGGQQPLQNGATGAKPKQKAGNAETAPGQIHQEVPRPTSSDSRMRGRGKRPLDYHRNTFK